MAAIIVFLMIMLAMFGGSDASWCICRPDASAAAEQKALDYACGAGADCSPILQNGACYNPNSVSAHCSYATNSYYQRKSQTGATCDFSGTATLTNQDPSTGGCTYPSSASAAGTGTTTPPTNTPASSTPPGTFTPSTSTPTVLGLGPSSATSVTPDGSDGGFIPKSKPESLLLTILFSGLLLLRT